MNQSAVDVSQLAIDRASSGNSSGMRLRRHLLTRYLIPVALVLGFASIVLWAAWDYVSPPLRVSVTPVIATQESVLASGTPLFNAAGWIEPRPTPIRVPGLAAGVIEELLVVEDQLVKAGEPVAQLIKDDARLTWEMNLADQQLREAEYQHAKAALVAAKTRMAKPVHLEAPLANADAALATLKTELANLPFQLKRAEAQLEFAEREYQRHVRASDSVSQREVEDAKTQVATLRALANELKLRESSLLSELKAVTNQRDAIKEQLDLLIDEIQNRDQAIAQVAMAKARLDQCIVAVAEAKLRLDRMTVVAPVDGRILLLVSQPGTRIGGQRDSMSEFTDGSTVVTMYQPGMLQIKVDVRFEDIPNVQLNQPVRIDNPALSEPLTGQVLYISSEADIQKNTLEVKVAIDNPPEVFKPEMLVDVTFLSPKLKESSPAPQEQPWRLFIPRELLTERDGVPGVWVADRAKNRARFIGIQTENSGDSKLLEVVSGLDLTSRLIASGHDQLNDGSRIAIIEP